MPIGQSDFKKMIENDYFYIDKTLLIEELWNSSGEVILIPRPSRFGKTLNLSMLRYFFEKSDTDYSYLFKDTKISQKTICKKIQSQFPVIFLTFKDIKPTDWETAYKQLIHTIAHEFDRHSYLLKSDRIRENQKTEYARLSQKIAPDEEVRSSIKFLIQLLEQHHQKRVIVLIDEYDSPIHAAHSNAYYTKMVEFIRSLLTAALKDNGALERGFLTGILRTAKEGIFSGLNNPDIFSLLSPQVSDKFGFTSDDVDILLTHAKLTSLATTIKAWYNGYRCGNIQLYNPWSLLMCVDKGGQLIPYWANTSDNALIERLIASADSGVKTELEALLNGEPLKKEIKEAFVFPQIGNDSSILWSLLLFTGYVTFTNHEIVDGKHICDLAIPNTEIEILYNDLLKNIFLEIIPETKSKAFIEAMTKGNVDVFGALFQEFVLNMVSTFDITKDEAEKSCHLFTLGMLAFLKGAYIVKSNGQSGFGRYDIIMIPKNPVKPGIIIEFKKATGKTDMALGKAADVALKQIDDRLYAQILKENDVKYSYAYGIAIAGKKTLVKLKQLSF